MLYIRHKWKYRYNGDGIYMYIYLDVYIYVSRSTEIPVNHLMVIWNWNWNHPFDKTILPPETGICVGINHSKDIYIYIYTTHECLNGGYYTE